MRFRWREFWRWTTGRPLLCPLIWSRQPGAVCSVRSQRQPVFDPFPRALNRLAVGHTAGTQFNVTARSECRVSLSRRHIVLSVRSCPGIPETCRRSPTPDKRRRFVRSAAPAPSVHSVSARPDQSSFGSRPARHRVRRRARERQSTTAHQPPLCRRQLCWQGSPIIRERVTLKSLATAARLASSSLSRWVLSVTLSLPIIRFATSFEIECAAFVTSLCIPASFNWFR